ncbi:MAG: O-antigen ligase family protein [Bacteroidota bacterium]
MRTKKAIKNFFWCIFIPLMITVLITLLRHAMIGFSFQDVHTIFHPFHRNHVNYAALIALFFPFVINALSWYPRKSTTWYLIALCIPILLIATYLSFTRAAYVALIIAGACYFVFKWKLIRYAILAAIIIAPMVVNYVVEDNKYLEFAPDYNRTVTHTKFNNLIDATYKGEDISTMERVYRWVAGGHMVSAHPLVGVGPGNFVNFYRSYTVNSFQTYVSDNEDNSGIHSYYLMTMVEQGIPGLLIYLLLCFATLIMGERIYHRLVDPFWKNTVMAALLCMIIIDAFQIINDMLETDKMGPFFFFTIAILIVADLHHRKKRFRGLNSKN